MNVGRARKIPTNIGLSRGWTNTFLIIKFSHFAGSNTSAKWTFCLILWTPPLLKRRLPTVEKPEFPLNHVGPEQVIKRPNLFSFPNGYSTRPFRNTYCIWWAQERIKSNRDINKVIESNIYFSTMKNKWILKSTTSHTLSTPCFVRFLESPLYGLWFDAWSARL